MSITIKPPRHKWARCRCCFELATVMVSFVQEFKAEDGAAAGSSNHEESIHLCDGCRKQLREAL